jgi:hypothetical protein
MSGPKANLHRGSGATNGFRYAIECKLEVPDFFPMEPRVDSFKFDKALTPYPDDLAIAIRINGIEVNAIFDLSTSV